MEVIKVDPKCGECCSLRADATGRSSSEPGTGDASTGTHRVRPAARGWTRDAGHSLMEKPPGSSCATLQRSSSRAPRGCARHGRERRPPARAPPRRPRPYLGLVRPEVEEEVDHQLHQPPLGHCGHNAGSARAQRRREPPPPPGQTPGPGPLTAAFLGPPHAQLRRQLRRLLGQSPQFLLVVAHGRHRRDTGARVRSARLSSRPPSPVARHRRHKSLRELSRKYRQR